MEKETKPAITVTILPDVYDPERYRRGVAVLRQAFTAAVSEKAQGREQLWTE